MREIGALRQFGHVRVEVPRSQCTPSALWVMRSATALLLNARRQASSYRRYRREPLPGQFATRTADPRLSVWDEQERSQRRVARYRKCATTSSGPPTGSRECRSAMKMLPFMFICPGAVP